MVKKVGGMFVSIRKPAIKGYYNPEYIDSIDYKVGQEVEICRLIQRYTQIDLADEIGVTYQEIHKYEQGYNPISIETLYKIAKALSVNTADLLPEPKVLNEDCYFEGEAEKILSLVRMYEKIENQELRKAIYSLVEFAKGYKESSRKEAREEVSNNLVKENISVSIILQATGLSTCKYTEKKVRTDSIDYKIGQRVEIIQLIRGYTQEDLANKIGVTPKEINDYEQWYIAIPLDTLYEIAKALSVKVRVLLPEIKKDESNEVEISETENQESWSRLSALVETLSKSMKVVKEKVKKAEKIKVAKNLVKAGVAIEIISRATSLCAGEFA
ncbi:WO male-killing family protein Wmk [Wolbachia endosymbiont of Ceratitis capitata]|uniref:WO male-killing family protein Wmk n=1 Tax=Wolbachia endosymbiont of Ceratitis capitata TaxID=323653 RepID=UPI001FE4EE73|nr:helix-turn-helix domain-containing protein [Wolbachia endosymbiont of Ceratitis capitata]